MSGMGRVTTALRSIGAVRPRPQPSRDLIVAAAAGEEDGDDPLASMMGEMARALDADGVLVAWHDDGGDPVFLFADGACEPASPAERAMRESAAQAAVRGVPGSQWRTLDDGGASGLLTTSIPASGGLVTITTFFRRIGETTRVRARDAATRLLPLLQPFFRLWSQRLRAMSRVRGLTAAVNKSDVGILLVNRHGELTFANAAAEALIAHGDGLRRSGAMLSGAKLADTLRLQAAIEHVISAAEGGAVVPAAQAAPVVALNRGGRRPLMAAVVAGDPSPAGAVESAAIIYVFDPEQDLRPLLEPACKLYGLSPVETRLACLLADGVSLAEAAERMRVREQTARSYLKQIFLKTETNRQAELVWLMLKSSVRTAPGCHASFV